MSKHTPGPWKAGRADMATLVNGVESKWIYAGDKYVAVASGLASDDWDEVMANARLIARAPEMADTIAALTARVEELEAALTRMIDLCTVGANPGAFDNGISDSTGTIDEGDFIAGRIIDDARAAITQETRK